MKTPLGICWFCGSTTGVEVWRNDALRVLMENTEMPMCDTHSATTRASLSLRKFGEDELANELDGAIGIDMRHEYCKWIAPKHLCSDKDGTGEEQTK